MLIWSSRNTEDGERDNNYHFKENYCLIPNEKSILPDQKKKKLEQTILELHGI